MKQEIAKKWVKALRSGKYKQGRPGVMRCSKGYCCLGVLEQLAIDEGVTPVMAKDLPHKSTVNWAGLCSDTGEFPAILSSGEIRGVSLVILNDDTDNKANRRATFKEIADIIEAYAEDL